MVPSTEEFHFASLSDDKATPLFYQRTQEGQGKSTQDILYLSEGEEL